MLDDLCFGRSCIYNNFTCEELTFNSDYHRNYDFLLEDLCSEGQINMVKSYINSNS